MKNSSLIALLGMVSAAGSLCAADGKPEPCSLGTIKGEWGMVVSGLRPSAPNGPLEQFVGTLIRRYDGNGGFTQVDNVHGAISGYVPDRPGKGTYMVNSDCTGVAKLEIPGVSFMPEERFVVVDDRNGMVSATTAPPPLLATNQARRIDTIESAAKAEAHGSQDDKLVQIQKLLNTVAFRLGLVPSASN
jgi:hypothetical protein